MSITRRKFLSISGKAALAGLVARPAWAKPLYDRVSFADGGDDSTYQYIVVGSGAGGGPLAANLARAGYRVLLLEAGGATQNRNYETPAYHTLASEDPNLSWQFFVNHYTDPKRQAEDSKYVPGQGILYPRGSTLGGSTGVNAMITLYPDRSTWDQIASVTGDSSWDGRNMRGYFDEVHKWLPTEQSPQDLVVQDPNFLKIILSAGKQNGSVLHSVLTENAQLDPNRYQDGFNGQAGLFSIPKATLGGRRHGSREYLLATAEKYPKNLEIKTHCLVTRLIFDPNQANRVIGVEYRKGERLYRADALSSQAKNTGSVHQALATEEVVLAGGAFNTPQLLMLSGIGDEAQLNQHKIQTRVHLPGVGRNLQDRYEMGVAVKLKEGFRSIENCKFGEETDPCWIQYQQNPAHTLYGTNGVAISLLLKSSPEKQAPDLCLFGLAGKFTGYYPGYSQKVFNPNYFTWAILKGHTENNGGYVRLKSNNALDTPEINFKYFDEGTDLKGDDLKAVIHGLKTARKINASSPFRSIIDEEASPGLDINDDQSISAFIQRESWGHHASCTSKIGDASDPMAVVDSRFRVHGVKGLRIVDASVFPKIPGLFISTPIYMISQKATQVMLEDVRART